MGDLEMLRERRRAKILQNPENRMKKLLGYSETDYVINDNSKDDTFKDEGDIKSSQHICDAPSKIQLNAKIESRLKSNDFVNRSKTENIPEVDSITTTSEVEHVIDCNIKEKLKLRFFLMLLSGVIIRLLLESSMNVLVFKQNVIYQFILLQIFLIIFLQQQKSKPGSTNLKGRDYLIMSYFLKLMGATDKLTEAMLSLYSLGRTVLSDFCVFIIAFASTHFIYSCFNV